MGYTRRISESIVSDGAATGDAYRRLRCDYTIRLLQQNVLRLQVIQIVMGITLMVLSGVALIEEKTVLGLGFGLISAIFCLVGSAMGIHQTDMKISIGATTLGLIMLFPTLYFVLFKITVLHFSEPINENKESFITPQNSEEDTFSDDYYDELQRENEISSTVKALTYLELLHLIPMGMTSLLLLHLFYKIQNHNKN